MGSFLDLVCGVLSKSALGVFLRLIGFYDLSKSVVSISLKKRKGKARKGKDSSKSVVSILVFSIMVIALPELPASAMMAQRCTG